ncbi:MAG TPA: von Willebrand factor type A domain-containing protein [Chitinophagaceae bacterium]|nr:von Willebrand factor type A domain-containing protein [Chitinophagaceae bacterium]
MKKIILLLLLGVILIVAFRSKTEITITGNIKNETGAYIAATVKAGDSATTADVNGNYTITVDESETFIVFSAVGYQAQKRKINKRKIINVVLKQANSALHDSTLNDMLVSKEYKQKSDKSLGYASAKLAGRISGVYTSPAVSQNQYYRDEEYNTEEYSNIVENGFHKVSDDPLSTFSIDVDAASYSNVRRYLNSNQLPPAGAVRTEEMINYFKYQYPQPTGKDPFSINTEISDCPWNTKNKLVLIGLQGKNIPVENLPASNLVFLIDVSGSMMDENKLPLVKASMKMLTDQLREKDRISIVVYAGNAGLVLPSTSGADKIKIKTAIDALEAGGSTAGGEGIQLAYKTAKLNFMEEGNNRIILCTDGDFNVGASSDDDMVRLIEKERNQGIYLTVLGYGMGNYKDSKMQQLADKGNGNHAYIDGINEAKKVLVNEFGGTLFTIAKDVKLQIEFNPEKVAGYRLIGYENRMLNKEDFNDDKKDAGELGSGHTVTALYEIIPAGVSSEFLKNVDQLKYQTNKNKSNTSFNDEILTVKFRYKTPAKDNSELIVHPVIDNKTDISNTSDNFRFATSVAAFAMLLRNSEYKGSDTYDKVLNMATASLGNDAEGYRKEFVSLVKKARMLNDDTVKK